MVDWQKPRAFAVVRKRKKDAFSRVLTQARGSPKKNTFDAPVRTSSADF